LNETIPLVNETIPLVNETIPLSKPDIAESDIDAVAAVLRSSQLSLGPKLAEFEEAIAAYIGVPYALGVSSGTAGLYLALQALGIEEGDEIILPSFAFIAAANAVLQCRATPVFADIDPVTLNVTADSIAPVITSRSRAILVVHTFGIPADMDPILTLAREHGLRVIEDACEAIGAEYRARKAGSLGDIGVFSFYPNKPITTGEGGAVTTRDAGLARRIRALRNQGRAQTDGWLEHSLCGGNYRLSDIHCGLGLAQLKRIEGILARREEVACRYVDALRAFPEVGTPPMTVAHTRISWFAFVVRISDRDRVVNALTKEGISCRPYFPPVHLQPLCSRYTRAGQDLSVTEDITSRTVALPFFNSLKDDEIQRVCQVLGCAVQAQART
jgi:perosamine synthetase